CLEDIRYESLGIAINDGKPGALDLHHEAMAFPENMVLGVEVDGIFLDFVWDDGFGLFEAFAEAAAENIVGDHKGIALHLRWFGVVWVDVDELYDPVGVAARSGRKQLCRDAARQGKVAVQRGRGPGTDIGAALDEPLVFGEPGVPARAFAIGLFYRPDAIGY